MGVKIEVLYTKDTPFVDMIAHLRELIYDVAQQDPRPLTFIPVPFLERVLETRSLTVIHDAMDQLADVFTQEWRGKDWSIVDGNPDPNDLKAVLWMKQTNNLDAIWLLCHELLAQPKRNIDALSRVWHRREAETLMEWINKRTPAKNTPEDIESIIKLVRDTAGEPDKAERQLYDDLLASRPVSLELLSQKQQPSSPMDIAAAKVLKSHHEAGTLDSVTDAQLEQQVKEQYLKDQEQK
jgi:hypothetical protein